MPRAKKTSEDKTVAAKPATKPKITKSKSKSTPKTTVSKPAKSTSSPSSKLASIEKRLHETEEKLNSLITIIHNDLQRGQLKGPEGLASKLRRAGLLS